MASTEDIAIFIPSLILASGIRIRHFSSIGRSVINRLILVWCFSNSFSIRHIFLQISNNQGLDSTWYIVSQFLIFISARENYAKFTDLGLCDCDSYLPWSWEVVLCHSSSISE